MRSGMKPECFRNYNGLWAELWLPGSSDRTHCGVLKIQIQMVD